MKAIGRIAVGALVLGLMAGSAAAQTHGNVKWAALPGAGVTIAGDFGMGLNDDAKFGDEAGMYFGGRAMYGASMFSVYAMGGAYPIGVDGLDSEMEFGGGLAFHAINKADMPISVSVQAGVGYVKSGDETELDFIGGVPITINIPSTGVSIKPWVMPRVHYIKITDIDGEIGFGASGGLQVVLPMGFGFNVGVDWQSITFGDADAWQPMTFGAGVQYTFKMPG
jgi:hypothetical protein